jgi:hypothetical protein
LIELHHLMTELPDHIGSLYTVGGGAADEDTSVHCMVLTLIALVGAGKVVPVAMAKVMAGKAAGVISEYIDAGGKGVSGEEVEYELASDT